MKATAQAHLFHHSGKYYFRISIPKRLVSILGRDEYKRSLKTSDFYAARRKCRVMSNVAEAAFEWIADMSLTSDELKELACNFFETCLMKAYFEDMAVRQLRSGVPLSSNPADPYKLIELSKIELRELQERARSQAYDEANDQIADQLLAWKGHSAEDCDLPVLYGYLIQARLEAKRIEHTLPRSVRRRL